MPDASTCEPPLYRIYCTRLVTICDDPRCRARRRTHPTISTREERPIAINRRVALSFRISRNEEIVSPRDTNGRSVAIMITITMTIAAENANLSFCFSRSEDHSPFKITITITTHLRRPIAVTVRYIYPSASRGRLGSDVSYCTHATSTITITTHTTDRYHMVR